MPNSLPRWCLDAPKHGWASKNGLRELRTIVTPLVPFQLDKEQYGMSAQAMDRNNLFVIRATSSGKTMVVIVPLLARPSTIALIISPLNMLEHNMVRTFESFGIPAVAINGETLRAAARDGRNLWHEAATHARAIFMAPERLPSDEFDELINSSRFRQELALVPFDEAQVVDDWGDEFRIAYATLGKLRARLPPWVTYVALTATCRPGLQTTSVAESLGFFNGNYILHRGDCERHDLRIIVRPILHGISGYEFPDLDWLIPPDTSSLADLVQQKTILYCTSMELGHRVMVYLRSLLPEHLRRHQHSIIRHTTSLSCSQCKEECLDALLDAPGATPCAIQVATDIIGFGVDARRVDRVICFDVPTELNTLLQRIGRTGRRGDECQEPVAYIYLKESLLRTAVTTDLVEDGLPEQDLSVLQHLHTIQYEPSTSASRAGDHAQRDSGDLLIAALQRATNVPKSSLDPTDRFRALLAVVQAFTLAYCITLRINQLYDNPGKELCQRCSSCIPDKLPPTRAELLAHGEHRPSHGDTIPRIYTTMPLVFVDEAVTEIQTWIRRRWLAVAKPSTFQNSTTIIDQGHVRHVAKRLLKLTSKAQLDEILQSWSYLEEWGTDLWAFVCGMRERYADLVRKDKAVKAKAQREKRKERAESDGELSDKENIPPNPKQARVEKSGRGRGNGSSVRSHGRSRGRSAKRGGRR